ncbi:GntR family transcriptional regulator [Leifsonia shinshuensis]|uniref:GntR family transcriptional regulator n=1 Tax=Leifsonia shinshuensis TaxID=150026 RepID=UPI001F50CC17|nr:GntR family transcriptional regulator [Leifsonia shinshuensis]MCI0159362.1 GntR family transcriptional regulator [Leifsonia shinshuensis]
MPVPDASGRSGAPRELLRDRVYTRLKDAILTGVLLPGERLDEAELRGWLGVSGTPIRQALHTLSLEGLVQTAPQSHSAVIAPRPEQALETLQTIGVLLAGATLLAVPSLDADERSAIAAQIDEVVAQLGGGDVPAITRSAEALFTSILLSCPNPVLLELIARAAPSLSYHVSMAYQGLPAELRDLAHGYEALKAALENGDDREAIVATKRIFGVPHPTA